MKFSRTTRFISLAFALVMMAQSAIAQEYASLPYQALYRLANPEMETLGESSARMTFKISSKNPEVTPSQISAHIRAGDAKIPVAIAPDGTMVVPLKKAFLESNAALVTNQPKGSLNLEVTGSVQGSVDQKLFDKKKGRIRYSVFFPQSDLFQEEDGLTFDSIPDALLQLKSSIKEPALRIESRDGAIHLQPNADGVFRIEFSEALLNENPWVYLTPNWFGHEWKFDTAAGAQE